MWEWSNRTVKKKPPEKTDRNAASLLAAYNDLIGSGYSAYQSLRSRFFKLIGYADAEDCRYAGLNDNDIACLREGFAPENYNIHLKVPADFGGSLDFDNFSLIQTRPHHAGIHRIIDMQIENNFLRLHKKIFLPWFEGKFYYD